MSMGYKLYTSNFKTIMRINQRSSTRTNGDAAVNGPLDLTSSKIWSLPFEGNWCGW